MQRFFMVNQIMFACDSQKTPSGIQDRNPVQPVFDKDIGKVPEGHFGGDGHQGTRHQVFCSHFASSPGGMYESNLFFLILSHFLASFQRSSSPCSAETS